MVKVDIDLDTAENVFCVVLKQQYDGLSADIGGCPMFSMDEEENKVQYEAFKKAFELVMDYNGVLYKQERSER